MNLCTKICKACYAKALNETESDLRFHYLWRALNLLIQNNKDEDAGLRASIRSFIENNIEDFDKDVDYEDERLDVFYERPVFNDLRVEEDRDIYYYQDFNTNRAFRPNDDYGLSVKTFKRILDDSDLPSFYMSIFKIYEVIIRKTDDDYSDYEKRLMDGSIYLLECALNNLFE